MKVAGNIMELIGHTPLLKINRMAQGLPGEVLVRTYTRRKRYARGGRQGGRVGC